MAEYTLDPENLNGMSTEQIKAALSMMRRSLDEPDVTLGSARHTRIVSYIRQLEAKL